MNIQRLKFAWARGARIQKQSPEDWHRWDITTSPNFGSAFNWRIHPDDEHLQYGPVSTALRAHATHEQTIAEYWGRRCDEYEPGCPVCDAWAEYDMMIRAALPLAYAHSNELEISNDDWTLLRLFVAELLADEGL